MGKDYYKILGKQVECLWFIRSLSLSRSGLGKGASDDEIKKAYRKL